MYVGTAPGIYDEEYDVGRQTSFVYARARSGERYYFSVAAYSPGPVVGPRSAAISYLAGAPSPQATASLAPREAPPQAPDAQPPDRGTDAVACAGLGTDECYAVRTRLQTTGRLHAIATTPDGRVFAIADGSRVLVHAAGDDAARVSLVAENTTFTGLAIDPGFATSRFVYVGEVEEIRRSGLEMAVVRYREVRGLLGERAAIVSGIPVATRAGAPFTLDADGNIYIAVPHDERRARDPYARSILRFAPDGTVHRDAPGLSPVFAQGITEPLALAWTTDGRLWITGTHLSAPQIAYAGGDGPAAWPTPLYAAIVDPDASRQSLTSRPPVVPVFLPASPGRLVRCAAAAPAACAGIDLAGGEVTAAATRESTTYVTAAHDDGTTSILELQRAD